MFIGGLGAMLAWESITAWRLEQATKAAAYEMQKNLKSMKVEEQNRSITLERMRQISMDAEVAKQAAQAAAEKERKDKAARKESAWQRFYQPSAACRHDSADILCANAHMAAKKKFEAQYVD